MSALVFLDRDGVINEFPGHGEYVTRQEDFRFLPNAKKAIELLTRKGFETNVISNQGCVSRGLIALSDLEAMTARMLKEIEAEGGRIHGVYYCIHQTSDACECKKPKTALFHQALRGRDLEVSDAYFIGDSDEDMQAGENLGCKTVLVLSGKAKKSDLSRFLSKPHAVKADLWEAAQWITGQKS